jgi:outer membrane cobalamin receptor
MIVLVLIAAGWTILNEFQSESSFSQAYIAGWNDMAPSGSALFGDGMNNPVLCGEDYNSFGGTYNETQWIQGCTAATNALNKVMNQYPNVDQWVIPRK